MVNKNNTIGSMSNMIYVEENNYNILDENTDVWHGELPFKVGDTFPTASIKERALVSKTNKLIYENDVDRIYTNIISIFPEIEPLYGYQVREIITKLPYFKNTTNYWVGLIAGDKPQIDGDEDIDLTVNSIIEESNFGAIIQNEVRSRFMDVIGAYKVDVDIEGKPIIVPIDVKNIVCFVSEEHPTSIEVNVVFSIYTDRETSQKYVEFIEYHYNGYIHKRVFRYADGKIGEELKDQEQEGKAFDGKIELSPIVIFKHNTIQNEIYGTDQFRYWSASILGAMRALQNVFRLGERTREMIRKIPEGAVKKNPATGSSYFFNQGNISYPDGAENKPEIEYITPDIKMEEAVKVFEKAIKSVSIDTNLGPVFFDLEKLGTNLSAKSIEAALYPTKIEARRITNEMTPSVKELVIKLCATAGIDITQKAKFSVNWYDGFPQDLKDYTDAIQSRLGNQPSISLTDAIMKLDKVPTRLAMEKANEILGYKSENTDTKVDTKVDIENRIEVTPGVDKNPTEEVVGDETLFESELPMGVTDIPINHNKSKEAKEEWMRRKLLRKG